MKTIENNPNYDEGLIVVLQKYLTDNCQILDIGCELGNQLFPFVDFKPKLLVGIDNNEFYLKHIFRNFLMDRNDYQKIVKKNGKLINLHDEDKPVKYWKNLFPEQAKIFEDKFRFIIHEYDGRIENYSIDEDKYDIIIVSNVLHFLEPNLVEKVIKKIISGTKKGGKIYISINQSEKYKTPSYVVNKKINDEIIFTYNKHNPSDKRYLYTKTGVEELIMKFPKLVDRLNLTDDVSTAFIVEK